MDRLYLIGYKENGYILKQAKEMGIKSQFLSTVTFEDPEILKIAKDAADGVIYSASTFDPKSERKVIQAFVSSFKSEYNQDPDIFAGLSYDAMKIMSLALTQGNYTGEGIKTALYNIKNYPGIAGETSFDINGDAVLSPILKTVQNGKFIPLQ
jgi:branched-chain amino acid transport system substrate-binding protein